MAAYLCSSCDYKYKDAVPFCPRCEQPTPFATVDEVRQWDLDQWRRHQAESSVAATGGSGTVLPHPPVRVAGESGAQRFDQPHRPDPHRVEAPHAEPLRAVPPREAGPRRKARGHDVSRSRFRLPLPRKDDDVALEARLRAVVQSPQDYQFIYEACTSCDRTDWILRTGRNEDESYNYWCVRCSRSFKTDLRLPHGRKPFITAGSILGFLALLTNIL